MIQDHSTAKSPCGAGSPFEKLLEANGKILFLGTSIETMTFFHYLEERFEDRLTVSPFTAEMFVGRVRLAGRSLEISTRLFDPDVSRRRRISVMLPELRRLGGIKEAKIGVLPVMLVGTEAAKDAFVNVLKQKESFYVCSEGLRI
jgi:aminoglycoside N3'-acetyltransferase